MGPLQERGKLVKITNITFVQVVEEVWMLEVLHPYSTQRK